MVIAGRWVHVETPLAGSHIPNRVLFFDTRGGTATAVLLPDQPLKKHPATCRTLRKGTYLMRIERISVDNIAFLIERIGGDFPPLQFVRELTQNAIEAVIASGREGRVVWDVNREYLRTEGVKKLQISDTGIGMTDEEIRRYINNLSSSLKGLGLAANYGLGAKVTAGLRNPKGMLYRTWKDGTCYVACLGRDNGDFGLLSVGTDTEGNDVTVMVLPDGKSLKPVGYNGEPYPQIEPSGTSVTLLGRRAEDDTTVPPEGALGANQWLLTYLNRRYYEFPGDVRVEVYIERMDASLPGGVNRSYRQATGMRWYLDQYAEKSGEVHLDKATARWWILPEVRKQQDVYEARGHTAALHQGELYEVRRERMKFQALQQFGIYAGHSRIVIYVEPDMVGLTTDTARTKLVHNGENMPWIEWGEQFVAQMPAELAAFMSGQVSTSTGDHRSQIRKTLNELRELLRLNRYRISGAGEELDAVDVLGGSPAATEGRERTGSSPAGGTGGRVGRHYLAEAQAEAEVRLVERVRGTDPYPTVAWVRLDHAREAGEMEDRAAEYVFVAHVLRINEDFRGYESLVAWATEEAKARAGTADDGLAAVARDEVQRWWEQALVEAVVSLRPLENQARWGRPALEAALSQDALTAVVLGCRSHMITNIKRGLSGRLGARRDRETAAQ